MQSCFAFQHRPIGLRYYHFDFIIQRNNFNYLIVLRLLITFACSPTNLT